MNNWIDVTDNLPEKGVDVLIYSELSNEDITHLAIAYLDEHKRWCITSGFGILFPLFWRPLPQPPKYKRIIIEE